MVFTLYFYYVIGTVLERIWGSFKFNVYYFSGVILHIIAAFVIYFIFGWSFNMSTYYINLALFLAFAVEQADTEVLLFFVLPIKMKWLGWLDGIIFAITIIGGYLTPVMPKAIWRGFYNAGLLAGNSYTCYVMATCALISMLNFIIFFFATRKAPRGHIHRRIIVKLRKELIRQEKMREVSTRDFIMRTLKKAHGIVPINRILIREVQSTDVLSVTGQSWMAIILHSDSAQNVQAILNIVRIICIHIYMLQVIITIRIHKKIKKCFERTA